MMNHAADLPTRPRRVVVGITGASGAIYAQRLMHALHELGHEIHLVCTDYGKRLLHDELNITGPLTSALDSLVGIPSVPPGVQPSDHARSHSVFVHPSSDVGASLGSGSFRHDGMVILPCSSNTLGAIVSGYGDHLLHRAAAVALKERFPLVVCHREAPLNRIDLENSLKAFDAGAIIMPTNPGFYLHPRTLEDLVDFVVARILDQLSIEHNVSKRWDQQLADEAAARQG